MKTEINGIKIVKNEASLYINGRMQYQAVNLVEEYGQKLNGCKYAIASKHPQWKMEKRFGRRTGSAIQTSISHSTRMLMFTAASTALPWISLRSILKCDRSLLQKCRYIAEEFCGVPALFD